MHDWFLTACLPWFCQQDKNVWEIWEVCFNLSVWPLAPLWQCRLAGNRREENLGTFMNFYCLLPLHMMGESQPSVFSSGCAPPLVFVVCEVHHHSLRCCLLLPLLTQKMLMLLLTIFAERLRNNHVLTRISVQKTGISVLQKNNFCLAVRFVLKALVKFSVDYFSYTLGI